MESNKVVIKKYENRRLYDTAGSRYINLEDVARMIRRGVDVQVIDARSGEDITRLILTQIIVEDAKEREFALPTDILRQLVLATGEAGRESVSAYWKAVSDVYQSALKAFTPPAAPLDFVRAVFPGPPAQGPVDPEGGEVDELRRRVERLERRLRNRRRPGPRR
jgi:polyhydroxyalkanoate synthesis repressor PhaR